MNQSSPKFVSRALSEVLPKIFSTIHRITAALVLFACVGAAAAQSDAPAFAKFKREMMPKVGQKISVVGTLSDGKEGFWLEFNNWGAYILAARESSIAKANDLYVHFHRGQTVKITGILRYRPGPDAATRKHAQHVQHAPEDFFFDAAEVKMSLWSPPAETNPKKERK
ncbi:MAG TPA: hypothetical protein VLA83_07110 [Candidatus Binatia bacterium]|nr:hypothetical protein [Candidatus Binatia bacterium]